MRKVGITQAFHVYVVGIQSNRGLRRLTYGIRRRLPNLSPFFSSSFCQRFNDERGFDLRARKIDGTYEERATSAGRMEGRNEG